MALVRPKPPGRVSVRKVDRNPEGALRIDDDETSGGYIIGWDKSEAGLPGRRKQPDGHELDVWSTTDRPWEEPALAKC